MKRTVCVLCATVLLFSACGETPEAPVAETTEAESTSAVTAPEVTTVETSSAPAANSTKGNIGPKAWKVTIEEIDLDLPESKKYIDWIEANEAETDEKPDPWSYVWEDNKQKKLKEKHQPWNDAMELVVQYTPALVTNATNDDNTNYCVEFLVRGKSTKETQLISEGYWSWDEWATGVQYAVVNILSDTHILYEKNNYCADCGDALSYYLYNRETGKSTHVADQGVSGDVLHYLKDMRYLFFGGEGEDGRCLYLIDLRKLIAGTKDAKRLVCRVDGFGYIDDISQDKRFVYINLFDNEANSYPHREIYDIDSGKRVADFRLPEDDCYSVLINDTTEYCYTLYNTNGDEYMSFYIIHYER